MAEHHHHHHHPTTANFEQIGRAFVVGIVLNLFFVLVEFVCGLYSNSLALMSDAGHNLSDVASLGLSLFAIKLAKRKSDTRFTYGFQKGTVLASLANAVILLIAVGGIGFEAFRRLTEPAPSDGLAIVFVAGIGVLINAASAILFHRHQSKDLNVKGAYLHLLTDALVSVGVVLTGLVIYYTDIRWLDPIVSIVIMVVVIYSTWGLLRESLNLALDAVPQGIDPEIVRSEMLAVAGIRKVYHVHIWAMATTKTALTAHLVLERTKSDEEAKGIKSELRHRMELLGIQHCTFETELFNEEGNTN